MAYNQQQFPPRMDLPQWYSDAPRPVPSMLDENEFDVDHGIECQLRGCLAPLAMIVVLWACLAGLACGQTFALQPAAHDPSAKIPQPPNGKRLISVAQLQLPGVDGLTVRSRKHWNWAFVDACAATARQAGDAWTWLPCGGDEANPLSAASLAARQQLYRDGAARYSRDGLLYAVHATVPPYGHSEECFYGNRMSAAAKEAQKRIIATAAAAFPRQRIIWTGSPEDPAANLEIVAYGVRAAPGRFVYKMNAMSPKAPLTWNGITLLIDAAKLGADIGFEELQPSTHQKFGGTWPQFVAKVAEVERRAGKPFVYEAIYPGDLAKLGGQ